MKYARLLYADEAAWEVDLTFPPRIGAPLIHVPVD